MVNFPSGATDALGEIVCILKHLVLVTCKLVSWHGA
jgi:hypothetical protein